MKRKPNPVVLLIVTILVVIMLTFGILLNTGLIDLNNSEDKDQNNINDNSLNQESTGQNIEDKDHGPDIPTENEDTSNQTNDQNETKDTNETADPEEQSTQPKNLGKITIESVGEFWFDPIKITTVRADIFKPGYFSIFDIVVYLDSVNSIDLAYHFDESMNTHVIDSINNKTDWWYYAHYDGGWRENNAFRMDHYPFKDNSTIKLYQEPKSTIDKIHKVYRNEITRKDANDGNLIIPEVIISGPTTDLTFKNVEVTAHNLRNDSFQDGIITAIDVIMSLGDQNKITYDIKWVETIASADPVKDYWVYRINNDEQYDTCGWVYEAGAWEMGGRNHIHIPSDQRIINSPEYEEWFWICI